MKRIFILLLLINVFQNGSAQRISGVIFDKSDNSRISFASVYFNGTSVGTHSDQDGHFDIDVSKFKSFPLTISALGYYTITQTDFSIEKPIEVFLVPKVFELNEVVVTARTKAKDRKSLLKLFRNQFLGSGYNGQNCVILNEEEISFETSGDTLNAYASKPLIIVNNALGYKITYFLDKFKYYRKDKFFLYEGSAFFNEDMSEGFTKRDFFYKRRKNAYLGSRCHFFNSLWTNSLKSNGFTIKNSIEEELYYNDLVDELADFKKFLSYKDNLYIYYFTNSPNTILEPLKNQIFFEMNGYFDGSGLRIFGQMAQQRIGDLLPYDYGLK